MIRVLIADDQAEVRSALRLVLDSEPDIEVVAEAADGAEAVRRTDDRHPTSCSPTVPPVVSISRSAHPQVEQNGDLFRDYYKL